MEDNLNLNMQDIQMNQIERSSSRQIMQKYEQVKAEPNSTSLRTFVTLQENNQASSCMKLPALTLKRLEFPENNKHSINQSFE